VNKTVDTSPTIVDSNLSDSSNLPDSSITRTPGNWIAKSRDWISDCFSSIMVKEARQALKSYQFFGTYTLVIVAVATWALIVFVDGATGLQRQPNWERISESLFTGFCLILGVPLGIVVPFSAFRSLAKEYEDGTIQLISITTMKPYQIVIGKLGTAVLQMTIYLSVIAPCIALTYMLDAISYPLIVVTLSIAIGGSIFLTILGLLLAGASRSYTLSMGISVFFVLGLGGLFIAWCNLVPEMVSGSMFDANFFMQSEGQMVAYGFVAFFGSTALLVLTAAAAQISFESDNRSTAIRIALLIQLLLFLALLIMASPFMRVLVESLFIIAIFCGHFWLIVGSLIIGERPGLSQRVQRSLPKTLLGRSVGSMLMPGPGRGYLFSVGGLLGSIFAATTILYFDAIKAFGTMLLSMISGGFNRSSTFDSDYQVMLAAMPTGRTTDITEVIVGVVLITAYPLLFLSLSYLILKGLRAATKLRLPGAVGPLAGLFMTVFLVFSISVTAYSLWYNLGGDTNYRYQTTATPPLTMSSLDTVSHFNWYIGITNVGNSVFGSGGGRLWDLSYTFIPILGLTVIVSTIAFMIAIRELRYLPSASPKNVLDEIELEQAERSPKSALPAGESLDEIFGEIPKRNSEQE
jgi:ABC-type transport system involved in cytochrome c biogenesis permease component